MGGLLPLQLQPRLEQVEGKRGYKHGGGQQSVTSESLHLWRMRENLENWNFYII